MTQFGVPEKVIKRVRTGAAPISELSEYLKPIHEKHVIGINVAFMIGNWIDMVFFGDTQFYLKWQDELQEFDGLVVSGSNATKKYPWIKTLMRDSKHISGISDNPRAVSWNQNSGAAAISIAANAGAKRIFLLGFDMKLNDNGDQHFHGIYRQSAGNLKKASKVAYHNPRLDKVKLPFERHLAGFPAIAQDALARGIEIINVNPDSAIESFRKVNLSEVL